MGNPLIINCHGLTTYLCNSEKASRERGYFTTITHCDEFAFCNNLFKVNLRNKGTFMVQTKQLKAGATPANAIMLG